MRHPAINKLIIRGTIALVVGLSGPQLVEAQGTLCLSSLGLTSAGTASVASNSWLGVDFQTGTNAGGYLLNSVQLSLGDASGNPSGFTAMIYAGGNYPAGGDLGSNICTLSGSLEPVTAGIYTYSPASTLILSPREFYFVVLTASTPVADGVFAWSVTSTFAPTVSGGWYGDNGCFASSDGLYWNGGGLPHQYAQFAIYATDLPVPEPSTFALLALGGLWLARLKLKAAG
jgi:hypothetical protein